MLLIMRCANDGTSAGATRRLANRFMVRTTLTAQSRAPTAHPPK